MRNENGTPTASTKIRRKASINQTLSRNVKALCPSKDNKPHVPGLAKPAPQAGLDQTHCKHGLAPSDGSVSRVRLHGFVTAAELASGLPGVLAAPTDGGEVKLLCARPKPNRRTFPDSLTITRENGVAMDFEMSRPWLELEDGRPDPRIQVSILPWRVLELVWRDCVNVPHPGDNIIADLNLTVENIPAGTFLSLGTAILKVSDVPNDGCAKWRGRYGKAAYDWVRAGEHNGMRLRGLFCSVVQDGVVRLGDRICKAGNIFVSA